jgi:hypothetical protein
MTAKGTVVEGKNCFSIRERRHLWNDYRMLFFAETKLRLR